MCNILNYTTLLYLDYIFKINKHIICLYAAVDPACTSFYSFNFTFIIKTFIFYYFRYYLGRVHDYLIFATFRSTHGVGPMDHGPIILYYLFTYQLSLRYVYTMCQYSIHLLYLIIILVCTHQWPTSYILLNTQEPDT